MAFRHRWLAPALSLPLATLALSACQAAPDGDPVAEAEAQPSGSEEVPHVRAQTVVEAGKYVVAVGGCNDCHTPGYLETGGNVPVEDWLVGTSLGHRGPWGTTYAANLRLRAQEMTEDQWFDLYSGSELRPPMPWMSLHLMSEPDLRAAYQFIRSLGPRGEPVPAYLPPGAEPETPFVDYTPQLPGE